MGKWHIGDCDGRWPTDHGFDEWYGPPHSYDEAMWETDPWYVPGRDPVSHMMEGRTGERSGWRSATLYSLAWLDLSVEPIVLEFPPIADRYFVKEPQL